MNDFIQNLVKFKDVNKSTIFLYTLLKLKKGLLKPVGTYMDIENCSIHKDMNLICVFHKQQEGFAKLNQELEKHPQFDYFVDDKAGFRFYIMDFSTMPEIYDAVKFGKYSQLSTNAKNVINMDGHPVGVIGVNPSSYYQQFSDQFDVTIESLKEKVELLEPPNLINETLTVSETLQEEFE